MGARSVPALVISSVSIPLACGSHPPSVDKIANQHPIESPNQRGEQLFALMEVTRWRNPLTKSKTRGVSLCEAQQLPRWAKKVLCMREYTPMGVRGRAVIGFATCHDCSLRIDAAPTRRLRFLAVFLAPGTGQFVRYRPAASPDLAGPRMRSNQTYPFVGTCVPGRTPSSACWSYPRLVIRQEYGRE